MGIYIGLEIFNNLLTTDIENYDEKYKAFLLTIHNFTKNYYIKDYINIFEDLKNE
jgi:hypothetical protein